MNRKKWLFGFFSLFCVGLFAPTAFAFSEDYHSPFFFETSGGDRYGVGESPVAPSETKGDLVIAGHTVVISKDVQEDLAAFGQNITVSGNIWGDARIVGQVITVSGTIGGHLAVAGQMITVDEGGGSGKIVGDLLATGQQLSIYTPVEGNVTISAEKVFIASPIGGDAHIVAQKVEFGEQGRIAGTLTLTAPKNTIPEGKAGNTIFHERTFHGKHDPKNILSEMFSGVHLSILITSLLVGLLLCWKMPLFSVSYGAIGKEKPFISLGIGFLVLFLTPIASLFFLPLFPIFLLVFFSYCAFLVFSYITSGFLLGAALVPLKKNPSFGKLFGSFAAGVGTIFVLGSLPYFGSFFTFLVFCAAMGSLVQVKKDILSALRKAKKI
ncbi:hypothetical protein IPN35_05345 [Candidatus Peregrinibacteria bacterium]|nr:MAG: hypothetical protein IPN35_05345 [Candidatus Peregrinibacteria bacterium]